MAIPICNVRRHGHRHDQRCRIKIDRMSTTLDRRVPRPGLGRGALAPAAVTEIVRASAEETAQVLAAELIVQVWAAVTAIALV